MIRKQGSKFIVTNSDGSETLGTHSSRKKALAQLRAIEASKAKSQGGSYSNGGTKSKSQLLRELLKGSSCE